MKSLRYYLFIATLLTTMPFLFAQPKVGLALGGGGAKGAATIGALKVLESAGIKVDYIAGTSIGAIVGGLYAAGYSATDLESYFLDQGWLDVSDGDVVEATLRRLLQEKGVESFDDTRIPFRCVTAEENTYNEVVLYSGKLSRAIRASMSVPHAFEPVKWGTMYLVDGGVANNLPVDVVRAMGADIVIAVDLQQKKRHNPGIQINGEYSMLLRWFLDHSDEKKREQNIKDADIYIHPNLKNFTAFDFGKRKTKTMLQLGKDEAMRHWEELIKLRHRQRY